MINYLTYGLVPAVLLTVIVGRGIGGSWSLAAQLARDDPVLSRLVRQVSAAYGDAWAKGILSGSLPILVAPLIILFQPADLQVPQLCILTYWFPAMLWARTSSWARLMRNGVTNTLEVLRSETASGPIVAYLRDRAEERRTMAVLGANGEVRVAPLQRGVESLVKRVPRARIFGFWDPRDERTGLCFSPLLSIDDAWRGDVERLCRIATVIVLDISTCSPSVEWEALFVCRRPDLRQKTLLLRARADEDFPPQLAEVPKLVRWVVTFDDRSDRAHSQRLDWPDDFLALAAGKAVWARS